MNVKELKDFENVKRYKLLFNPTGKVFIRRNNIQILNELIVKLNNYEN